MWVKVASQTLKKELKVGQGTQLQAASYNASIRTLNNIKEKALHQTTL